MYGLRNLTAKNPVQISGAVVAVRRFWPKVDRSGDCWLWLGAKDPRGYGRFRGPDGRAVLAHRFAYEIEVGPIPEGLTLDHLCRNTSCVNPAHLEPVSHSTNVRRGVSPAAVNARKTHCVNGHEFTPENTHVRATGRRDCRQCTRHSHRKAYWERKSA